ncbi:MAG TPA: protein kinase [Planctomycetaceae bacterium]|nr:protein kinase [Planctomycetaceae bacterium]
MPNRTAAGRQTRLLAAVFCEQCGITYVPAAANTPICPKCGSLHQACDHTDTHVIGGKPVVSASAADEVDDLIGQEFGVYKLEGLLGAGAMGRVYLARHLDLHRSCALKILPPRLAESDPAYVARFANEGRAAASLVHPNIITVHAIGEIDGYHFLEMEFVAGQSLQQRLKDEGPLTPERATGLVARIAEGLATAHSAGVLHRDLKPDNVLQTHLGVPKIADFGLAKRVAIDPSQPGSGEIVGTPPYMAPELFQGHTASPSSDVYALGICYYQLLTGRHPFASESLPELMRQVIQDRVPSPRTLCPKLPLEMCECLHTLLEKTPTNRPADAWKASQLLQAVLGQSEDMDSLMADAFRGQSHVTWTRKGDRFRVEIHFPTGRKQAVFVEPSDHAAAERLLMISSICAAADPAYYETALRLNSEILHGGLAVREFAGEPYFVMMDNYPRCTVDAEEIRRSVLEVAHRADAVERMLSDHDVN